MKRGKVVPLSAAVLMFTTLSANAADVYEQPGVYQAPIVWTGLYMGLNLGVTLDDQLDFNDIVVDVDEAFAGGVHIGYNWVMNRGLVYGWELDVGTIFDDVGNGDPVTTYTSTLRARLGYELGNALVYGTGGLALMSFDEDLENNLGLVADDLDDPSVGFVVGGGIAYKFARNWSVGVEGLYYDIFSDIGDTGEEFERSFFEVRARASYHLARPIAPLK